MESYLNVNLFFGNLKPQPYDLQENEDYTPLFSRKQASIDDFAQNLSPMYLFADHTIQAFSNSIPSMLPYSHYEDDTTEDVNPDIFLNASYKPVQAPQYEISYGSPSSHQYYQLNILDSCLKEESVHFDIEQVRENSPLIDDQILFSTADSINDKQEVHHHTEDCKDSHSKDNSADIKEAGVCSKSKSIQKHRKNISKCGHQSEQYYANGMCKNCYHAKGRTKMAFTCCHSDRTLYAKGLCKNCYLSIYHKSKRTTRKSSSPSCENEKLHTIANQ